MVARAGRGHEPPMGGLHEEQVLDTLLADLGEWMASGTTLEADRQWPPVTRPAALPDHFVTIKIAINCCKG